MRKFLFLLVMFLTIFAIDYYLKSLVHENLATASWSYISPKPAEIKIFSNWHGISFSIVHVTNKGAAWGLLASYQKYLPYLRILLITGLIVYLVFFNALLKYQIPLMMIIAGASCNVFDYFLYGHVIDMFHFIFWGYSYPVFNIADSFIFLGIAWIILMPLFEALFKKLKRG